MQLSLFDNQQLHPLDDILTERANNLLYALNDGKKKKDLFHSEYYFQEKDKIVLIAADKSKKAVCNVIDLEGNIPDGFSACWRTPSHIKQELGL